MAGFKKTGHALGLTGLVRSAATARVLASWCGLQSDWMLVSCQKGPPSLTSMMWSANPIPLALRSRLQPVMVQR